MRLIVWSTILSITWTPLFNPLLIPRGVIIRTWVRKWLRTKQSKKRAFLKSWEQPEAYWFTFESRARFDHVRHFGFSYHSYPCSIFTMILDWEKQIVNAFRSCLVQVQNKTPYSFDVQSSQLLHGMCFLPCVWRLGKFVVPPQQLLAFEEIKIVGMNNGLAGGMSRILAA